MNREKKLLFLICVVIVIMILITFIHIKYKKTENDNSILFENYQDDLIKIYDVKITKVNNNNIFSFKLLSLDKSILSKKIEIGTRFMDNDEVVSYNHFYINKISLEEPFVVNHSLDLTNGDLNNIKIEYEINYESNEMIISPNAG